MDELLIKYILGEASPVEISTIEEWTAASEWNSKYFAQFKMIWETSLSVKTESRLDAGKSWTEFKKLTEKRDEQRQEIVQLPRRGFYWMKMAAVLIALCSVSIILFNYLKSAKETMLSIQTTDQSRAVTLADGSVITLNKNSLLYYPEKFDGDQRLVTLQEGEAFFTVARDKNKPFIINVKDIRVRVVGTSFNIRNAASLTEVIVETGIVQVSRKKVVIKLTPKEKLSIDSRSGLYKKGFSADLFYNYYRTNEILTNNTPLWRIAEVLNEIYKVDIVIPDKKKAALQLSTTLHYGQLENNLNIICQTFNLKVHRQKNKIIIN